MECPSGSELFKTLESLIDVLQICKTYCKENPDMKMDLVMKMGVSGGHADKLIAMIPNLEKVSLQEKVKYSSASAITTH